MMLLPRYRPPFSWNDIISFLGSPEGETEQFEQTFAKAYGYQHGVWFPYGRVAVQAFLESIDSSDKNVVLSPFNCVALGNAIVSGGKRPFFVDTESDGFNHDPNQFAEAMKRKDTFCGIQVSLWGIPPSKSLFTEVFSRPVLYDFALRGLDPAPAELSNEFDAVMYSLAWGKPVSSLKGAILCGNSREQSARWKNWRAQRLFRGSWKKDFIDALLVKMAFAPGFFDIIVKLSAFLPIGKRLSGKEGEMGKLLPDDWNRIPSASVFSLGQNSLLKINDLRENRRFQVEAYESGLQKVSKNQIHLPPLISGLSHYPIRTDKRDELVKHFLRKGVFVSSKLFDHLLSDFAWLNSGHIGDFPNARQLCLTTLHLPLFFGMKPSDQDRVISVIQEFFE